MYLYLVDAARQPGQANNFIRRAERTPLSLSLSRFAHVCVGDPFTDGVLLSQYLSLSWTVCGHFGLSTLSARADQTVGPRRKYRGVFKEFS